MVWPVNTGSISGTTGRLIKLTSAQVGGDSIASESGSVLSVDGQVKVFATASGGWIDMFPAVTPPASGATIPSLTAWSAPHANFKDANFQIGDVMQASYHVLHGCNAAAGVYLHAHFILDNPGTGVEVVKFQAEYSYAHGYARGVFSSPLTTTLQVTPNGTKKTHYIAETAAPILVGEIETDGIIRAVITRVTNGGVNNTSDVLVEQFDAHAQLLSFASENRNYPFGA